LVTKDLERSKLWFLVGRLGLLGLLNGESLGDLWCNFFFTTKPGGKSGVDGPSRPRPRDLRSVSFWKEFRITWLLD
jgi:hypothetical protein